MTSGWPQTEIPDVPPDSAIFVTPTVARFDYDDVADRYAVLVAPDVPGGCVIYAEYRGRWIVNPPSARGLVATLLARGSV